MPLVKIEKLVLKNFKSFKTAEIPFSDGFTVIAGSNGSGKTNILDALMFVMGSTSLKTLRAGRLSDLVNNTAMENYAKVDLVIKHDSKKYEISRMIDKQGKSVYRLDSQRKTLNEISSLLAELGVRPDGHNIVVQGDATRIIEMSAEERRQIIDELAGLREFDEKKEEALKNLEKVDSKIKEANIVFAERENYLQNLEKDRLAAMEFGKLQEEKKQASATILHLEIEKISSSRKENTDKLFNVSEEQNSLQTKVSEEETKQKQLSAEAEELNKKIIGSSENIFSNYGIKVESKKSEKMLLLQSLETKKHSNEKTNSRVFSLNEKMKGLLSEENARSKELEEIERDVPELKKQLESLRKRKSDIESRGLEKEKVFKAMDNAISAAGEEETRVHRLLLEKRSEISMLRKEAEFKKQLLQETSKELEKAKAELLKKESKKQQLDSIVSKNPDLESELERLTEEKNKTIIELKSAEAKSIEAAKALEELKKQIAKCPVCESELTIAKKKILAEKKEDLIRQFASQTGSLLDSRKKLEAKILELEESLEKRMHFEIELYNFGELRQKKQLLESKTSKLTSELSTNTVSQKEKEADALEKELLNARARKKEKETELKQFKADLGLESVSSLANSIAETQTRASILENKKSLFGSAAKKFLEEKKLVSEEIEQLKKSFSDTEKELEEIEKKSRLIDSEMNLLVEEMKKAEKASRKFVDEKSSIDDKISQSNSRKISLLQKIKSLEQQANELKIDNSRLEVRLSDLSEEFASFANVQLLAVSDSKQLQKRVIDIEKRVAELGAINMKAVESFNELKQEVEVARQRVETLGNERIAVLDLIQKIDVKRTSFFMNCFNSLNESFSKMFFNLFGGEGRLSLSIPDKPLESGLMIEAKHKGSVLKNIDLMSGGEKTLAALAFLFAVQAYEPAPFYIFDEADAALDKENSAKIVGIIKQMSEKSQFIVVTHNDPLIQNADQLVGVALNKAKSSVIGLKLKDRTENIIQ